ncbi:MAG: FeoB-associated Cys-rich membrane protein [Acholeplasmataceae bacterium]|nr:FeoB-associated Cys-rich membrane protein [Acholeplasmataceae bacterium]
MISPIDIVILILVIILVIFLVYRNFIKTKGNSCSCCEIKDTCNSKKQESIVEYYYSQVEKK